MRCQIVLPTLFVSNCPTHLLGVKLSTVSNFPRCQIVLLTYWCQFVLSVKLAPRWDQAISNQTKHESKIECNGWKNWHSSEDTKVMCISAFESMVYKYWSTKIIFLLIFVEAAILLMAKYFWPWTPYSNDLTNSDRNFLPRNMFWREFSFLTGVPVRP